MYTGKTKLKTSIIVVSSKHVLVICAPLEVSK